MKLLESIVIFAILLKSYNMHIYQNEFETFVYSFYNVRNSRKYINYIHSIHTKKFSSRDD